MHPRSPVKGLCRCVHAGLILPLVLLTQFAQGQAQWVHFGTNGLLQYYSDNVGNQLPDFSYAGYMGGGVALPVAPDTLGTIVSPRSLNGLSDRE